VTCAYCPDTHEEERLDISARCVPAGAVSAGWRCVAWRSSRSFLSGGRRNSIRRRRCAAASVRDAVEAERRSLGAVHRLLARSDAQALAGFHEHLAMSGREGHRVCAECGWEHASPTAKGAIGNGELRDFIWNNGGWLCSTQPAVVIGCRWTTTSWPTCRPRCRRIVPGTGRDVALCAGSAATGDLSLTRRQETPRWNGPGIRGRKPKASELNASPRSRGGSARRERAIPAERDPTDPMENSGLCNSRPIRRARWRRQNRCRVNLRRA